MRSLIPYLPTLTASLATLQFTAVTAGCDRLLSHECDRIVSNASILFLTLTI
ncbi:hypothetical protein NDA00_20065 [Funiculus sociatus GB2-M2]|uniref:hypothetical protein n=1 Tax=Cyanophyceae TaxID=3028117 RepID=UPI001687A244|nr:hypothetical protein [Trichocoleus sp. FACHB-90]